MIHFNKLDELQDQKYEHEERAKKRLTDELKNPIFRKVFQQGGFGNEHRIVVFGQSGVGKTTLILKLLGAKSKEDDPQNNLVELARFIRGNTKEGGAGTATVFKYKISSDENGSILFPNNDIKYFTDLADLQHYLHEIRRKVESGKWIYEEPVTITLPSQYFENSYDTPWVITDIPGINSNEKREHKHVSDLIKAYVLYCNVLLIVERSSQIARLRSLKIPGFGPWQYFGSRCRLIVTHSLSENSVKERYRNSGKINTEELISDYDEMLRNADLGLEGINSIYPMDYGDSWAGLQENEKKLFENTAEAKAGVEEKLRLNLNESMKPEQEFKALMDIRKLEKRFNEDCKKYQEKIAEYKNVIKEALNKIDDLDRRISVYEERVKEWEAEKGYWKDKETYPFQNPWANYYTNADAYDKDHPHKHNRFWDKKRQSFKSEIRKYSDNVYGHKEKIDQLLYENYKDSYPPFNSSWREFAKEYKNWDQKYPGLLGMWGPFKGKHRRKARASHRRAVRDGLEYIFGFWTKAINNVVEKDIIDKIQTITDKLEEHYKAIGHLNYEKEELGREIDYNYEVISTLDEELRELEKSKEEDLSVFTEQYPRFRKEELDYTVNWALDMAKSSSSPSESFEYMAFCYQINQISKTFNL